MFNVAGTGFQLTMVFGVECIITPKEGICYIELQQNRKSYLTSTTFQKEPGLVIQNLEAPKYYEIEINSLRFALSKEEEKKMGGGGVCGLEIHITAIIEHL